MPPTPSSTSAWPRRATGRRASRRTRSRGPLPQPREVRSRAGKGRSRAGDVPHRARRRCVGRRPGEYPRAESGAGAAKPKDEEFADVRRERGATNGSPRPCPTTSPRLRPGIRPTRPAIRPCRCRMAATHGWLAWCRTAIAWPRRPAPPAKEAQMAASMHTGAAQLRALAEQTWTSGPARPSSVRHVPEPGP